ncbi:hypothetical protein ACIQFP_26740 [Nocardiopsis alba]|uniref:hypothetical protein n=1 Tax=Nocardiopsis alba TaxID=53437 RepID=UPI003801EED0
MSQTYWRWHSQHAPAFTAEAAYSADWGSEFTPDGTKYRAPSGLYNLCDDCQDETGACGHDDEGECESPGCECPGWTDCERGYSCCEDADDLVDYIHERAGIPRDDWGLVYVFEGEHTGNGTDGEPLVVPTRVVETLTWTELIQRTTITEA